MNNRCGINLWNFVREYSDQDSQLIPYVASLGYKAVEIPVVNTNFDGRLINKLAKENDLQVSFCACMTKGRDISNFDPKIRKDTEDYFKRVIELGQQAEIKIFCGPLYAGGMKCHYLSNNQKKEEWNLAVIGVQNMADLAEKADIKLGIEPLNRYRTSVINTVDQALEFIKDVERNNVGIHFDTYQAAIEEAKPLDALRKCHNKLIHFHASENNRSMPGNGSLPWKEIFKTLQDINYLGHITTETFIPNSFDSAWNTNNIDSKKNAEKGIKFLKEALINVEA